jgi:YD repeat-containing protein
LKYLARKAPLIALLIIFSAHAFAQGFRVESKTPPPANGSETFTSLEGRFSVALPKQFSGYNPQTINTPGGRVESFSYDWKTADGWFAVGYTQRPEMLEDRGQKLLDDIRDRVVASDKAKLLSETVITLGGHPGRELKMELPGGVAINRMYVVGNRLYQVIASLGTDKKDREPNAIKILDSFKLLSRADAEAETERRIAEATPSPLPQEPAARKLKSDAEDEGLKGRVKTVFTEEQDLSGKWTVQKRKPSSTDYYNEQGSLTKNESYDYMGNLFEITVYGYIDGERVSNYKDIEHEYNPPPIAVASAPGSKAESKFDPRYATKYGYKYDDAGRLVEEMLYGSNGKLWTKYVYNYKGNQKETLAYDEEGTINPKHSLNQKHVATLDARGNEVEESYYDVSKNTVDEKYSYTYEFDARGNWIKRTTSKWVKKDGKEYFEPYSVTYRTINY